MTKLKSAIRLVGVSAIAAEIGKVTCVLGRNGVGKTSLLRSIMGQEKSRSGSIKWEGRNITRMSAHDRAAAGIAMDRGEVVIAGAGSDMIEADVHRHLTI